MSISCIMGGSSRRTHRTKEMMQRSEFFAKLRDEKWRRECERKNKQAENRLTLYESKMAN